MPATFRHLDDMQQACSQCSLARLCLPCGLGADDVARLEKLVDVGRKFARNVPLFTQGDRLTAIYVVGSGALKTSTMSADGLEQITGFHYPGDLLGLDGVAAMEHRCSATALEDSAVCRIPFERLDALLDDLPSLRRRLMRLMSQALSEDDQLLLTLGRKNSEGRIASLLVSLASRREMRGMSLSPVHLSMKRTDLANYLGMRIETVSRVLRRLQESGIICVHRSLVDILDFDALQTWSSCGAWVGDRE
ncbi:helix-turn-helix domain-containing protein [Salinisphaera sp.]|uniref:helix-turn-helix domain-containing protein n=1 Tax=Salinisphaera sp. TaxID=1914330 RepID=UPI002D788D3F|nr:helix-turn-helix domain-containing protein [Salinisphaera sp.]HET7314299.1 helix-turn-helix domain-containing protein [Salinisphaera sp.]